MKYVTHNSGGHSCTCPTKNEGIGLPDAAAYGHEPCGCSTVKNEGIGLPSSQDYGHESGAVDPAAPLGLPTINWGAPSAPAESQDDELLGVPEYKW